MAQEKLKLPRSSYDELRKIVIAYGRHGEPATLGDIATLSGVSPTVTSSNNAFLIYCGIIQSGQRKRITDLGSRLATALEHDIESEVARAWREVVAGAEFLSKMNVAVRVRRRIEESNFVSHIAFSAGEKKSKEVLTGARTVVDILRSAQLIVEKDGVLVPSDMELEELPDEGGERDREPGAGQSQASSEGTPIAEGSLSIAVQVRVNCTPAELPELAKQLRLLRSELAESKQEPASTGTSDD